MKTCYDVKNKRWLNRTALRLPGHDLFFGAPENRPTSGIPIGDGDTGSLLWLEKDGIHVHINKCDLWQDAPAGVTWNDECYCSGHEEELTCVKHGGEIVLRLNSPAFENLYQSSFAARLSLADASATLDSVTPFGSVSARAFAENGATVLSCVLESAEGEAPQIRLSRWGSRTLWRWYAMQKPAPETSLGGTRAYADGADLFITQELEPTKFCIALRFISDEKPLFSGTLNSHTAALSLKNAPRHDLTLIWTVKTGGTCAEAEEACRYALDEAQTKGVSALFEEHRAAWAEFWERSFITLPDDYLENIWYLYLYYMNSESRGAYPPHFTSGLWGFYHDYIPWNYYFHYNEQHMYLPLDAAGHGELAENYFALRRNGMEKNRAYAELVKGKRGIFLHDVTDRYGRGAEYHYMNCSPGAQVAMHLWRHWRFTGDSEFLRSTALPFMFGVARFYLDMLEEGPDGLYHLHGTSAYESNETLDDACTDLTMIRTLFPVLLPYAEEPLRSELADALERLPEPILLPMRVPEDWDGERISFGVGKGRKAQGDRVFAVGMKDGAPVRHGFGDPAVEPEIEAFPDVELSPLYPSGLIGLRDRGTPLWDALENQLLLHRTGEQTGHWNMLPIFLARMGMGAEMTEAVRAMLSNFQGFPNGMNAEDGEVGTLRRDAPAFYNYENVETKEKCAVRSDDFVHFDFETEPIVAMALQESLLQSHEGLLRLFPASDGLPVAFRLFAEGGFSVGAEWTAEGFAATIESLRGEPCFIVLP
ncbi:MAG: hypothetical protein K6C36_10390, partial [Clostridia bacterium]|nr:hypothetical protein [Clostridia bacterium]